MRESGQSAEGQRNVFVKRYEKYVAREDREEIGEGEAAGPHASDNPMMVMVDESTGNKYMRAVLHEGLGVDGDHSWLVKDMHQELKAWGHPGGGQNPLVWKKRWGARHRGGARSLGSVPWRADNPGAAP